jgi:hypothetical protein
VADFFDAKRRFSLLKGPRHDDVIDRKKEKKEAC